MPPHHRNMVSDYQADNVYCTVKDYMRDLEIKQDPALALRAGWCLKSPWPIKVHMRRALKEKQVEAAFKLMDICQQFYPRTYDCAVKALKARLYERTYHVPPLTWMAKPLMQAPVEEELMQRNPYFANLPSSTWKLVTRVRNG